MNDLTHPEEEENVEEIEDNETADSSSTAVNDDLEDGKVHDALVTKDIEAPKSKFRRFFSALFRFFKNTHNGYLLTMFLTLALVIGYFMHQSKLNALQSQHESQIKELNVRSKKMMEAQNRNSIHQIAAPFSWAVRSELLRKNNEIVDQYMIELVKQPNFELIYIVDNKGKVILSSDKKYQDKDFKSLQDEKYLRYDDIFVDRISDSIYYCASPLLGFDSRIGTVFFEYHPKVIDIEKILGEVETESNPEK